jgi:hypothetical protein
MLSLFRLALVKIMLENPCTNPMRTSSYFRGNCCLRKTIFGSNKIKSFLVQQFFKNAAEVKGEEPLSSPAGDETPRAILRHTERRVRKATAFRGRANKTALPYKNSRKTRLENVPGEHFQTAN